MLAKELKKKYLEFFRKKGHAIIPSAPLIPENDPTVLFTNAGMHPLVQFLAGQPHTLGNKLANVQKCMRTQDIDEVGDATHTTFFEMLGNWSLGDYFKKEAITWSFEFLTEELNLPLNKIAVTCFAGDENAPKDEESAKIWMDLGIPKERIAFLGKEDNWWGPVGETGPCGPDTEMFFWVGEEEPPKKYDLQDERWVEIWNDVFMQYNKLRRTILVDGMFCIYNDNFEVNNEILEIVNSINTKKILVINGFREKGEKLLKKYGFSAFSMEEEGIKKDNPKFFDTLLKKFKLKPEEVIYFDHDKDNVKTAQSLGILSNHYNKDETKIIDKLKEFVNDNLFSYVPLKQQNVDTGLGVERVAMVLQGKSNVFETELFQPILKKLNSLSAEKLNDSNIFSYRIMADHLRAATFIMGDEKGVAPSNVDQGYILRRYIRRTIRHGKKVGMPSGFCIPVVEVIIGMYKDEYPILEDRKEFIVSELKKEEEKLERTLEKGLREFEKMARTAKENSSEISGKDAFLLFQSYGFPLEMTEEMADENNIKVDVECFLREFEDHKKLSREGAEKKFKGGLANLSPETTKLHTATHLLNEALRKVVDPNIKQKGSNITPERLRFDFSFDRKLTPEEIKKIEDEVNRVIREGLEVVRKELPLAEAEKVGAQKEFGHKYPDVVSVYFVGDYSKEFCGGPHVENTRELGHFHIKKEQSSAAGVRRIKAVLVDEPRS